MTRRRDTPAGGDEGLRVLAESFAPVCTLVGKASVLHVEKVVRVSREENLAMIADSVAFLVAAGKRVLLDAEHFFDGFALDPGYALRLPAGGAPTPGRSGSSCATPTAARCRPRSAPRSRSCAKRCRGRRWGSTATTTPAVRSRTR